MIRLRPIEDADLPFLRAVYASTREEELRATGWPDAEKAAFLRMQFDAQHRHYQVHYPDARFDVVLRGDEPLGRLYVDRRDTDIRIVDIALLPAHRGHGHGTHLLREILEEAAETGRTVSIHVERLNPALRLYERLGFTPIGDTGVHYLMAWTPTASRSAPPPPQE